MEKIIIDPEDVRAYGNVIEKKSRQELIVSGGTNIVSLGTQTVNNVSQEVFTIKRTDTVLAASNATTYVGTGTLSATLKTDTGTGIGSAELSCKIGTTTLTSTTNSSGVASFSLASIPAGTYTAYIHFNGDESYSASDKQVTVTVNKYATSLANTLDVSSLAPTETVMATFTLKRTVGNVALANTAVDVYVNEEYVETVTTNSSGVATSSMTFLTEGTRTIYAVYYGDDTYKPVTSSSQSVSVVKRSITVTISNSTLYYDSNSYTITLYDANNVYLANTSVTCEFKNSSTSAVTTKTVTTSSGVASFNMNNQLVAGTYTLKASYAGSTKYKSTSASKSITINKHATTTTLSLSKTKVTPTESSVATITLKTGSTVLSGYSVKLYEGSTLLTTLTTNSSGVATYTLNYDTEGTRSLKAVYDGNNNYASSNSSTISLQVVKHVTSLIGDSDISKSYYQTYNYSCRLKDTDANTYLANQSVTFMIFDANTNTRYSYTTTTDSNGYAIYPIPSGITGGTHTFNISYAGDTTHSNSFKSTTITVSKLSTRFDIEEPMQIYWLNGEFSVVLEGLDNTSQYVPLPNQTVKVTIDGYTRTATTDSDGVATFQIANTTSRGEYTVKFTFPGDNDYASVTQTITAEVTSKRIVTISIDKDVYVNPKSSGTVNIPVKLLYNSTAISNKVITYSSTKGSGTVTTNSSGVANIPLSLTSEGSWELFLSVDEDNHYAENWKYVTVHANNIVADVTFEEAGAWIFISWYWHQNDAPLVGKTVTITTPDGTTTTQVTDSDGWVGLEIHRTTLQYGEYTATYNHYSYVWNNSPYYINGQIEMIINDWCVISWTLRTARGGAVANAPVVITYPNNSKTVTLTTDSDGVVYIEDANVRGEYVACYGGQYCGSVKY